jgi:predicted aspartyl protease
MAARAAAREATVDTGAPTRRDFGALLAAGAVGLALARPAFAQDLAALAPETAAEPALDPTAVAIAASAFEHITAPVSINGVGPFRFMVDTGANRSCVNRKLAEQLALPAGPRTVVNTVLGARRQPSVHIDELQLGDRTQRRLLAPMLGMQALEIDGVLGVDWLKGQRLTLGLKAQRLEIGRSRRDENGPKTVVVPARRRNGQLTLIDADIDGRPISAIIDTGSQVTMINGPLRTVAERARGKNREPVQVSLITVAGERYLAELYHLPFMRVGGILFGNVPVVYADAHVFEIWGLKRKPAVLLGIDLLREFESVALDFGRSAVRFDFDDAVPVKRGPAPGVATRL